MALDTIYNANLNGSGAIVSPPPTSLPGGYDEDDFGGTGIMATGGNLEFFRTASTLDRGGSGALKWDSQANYTANFSRGHRHQGFQDQVGTAWQEHTTGHYTFQRVYWKPIQFTGAALASGITIDLLGVWVYWETGGICLYTNSTLLVPQNIGWHGYGNNAASTASVLGTIDMGQWHRLELRTHGSLSAKSEARVFRESTGNLHGLIPDNTYALPANTIPNTYGCNAGGNIWLGGAGTYQHEMDFDSWAIQISDNENAWIGPVPEAGGPGLVLPNGVGISTAL